MKLSQQNTLQSKLDQYNENVQLWNDRFANGSPMPVSESEIESSIIERVKKRFFSNSMTVRQKLNHTKTVIGDFAGLSYSGEYDSEADISQAELAYIIKQSAQEVKAEL